MTFLRPRDKKVNKVRQCHNLWFCFWSIRLYKKTFLTASRWKRRRLPSTPQQIWASHSGPCWAHNKFLSKPFKLNQCTTLYQTHVFSFVWYSCNLNYLKIQNVNVILARTLALLPSSFIQ